MKSIMRIPINLVKINFKFFQIKLIIANQKISKIYNSIFLLIFIFYLWYIKIKKKEMIVWKIIKK